MCPWEGNAVCLCWQRRYHPCSAPQREKREERGQLRKRADMRRNKPVIARDSAYSAKSTTMPVKSLSTLLAPSSHFGFSTFQRTGAGFKCMTATWDRGAVGSASYWHCFLERLSYARRQELKWRGGGLTEGELVGGDGEVDHSDLAASFRDSRESSSNTLPLPSQLWQIAKLVAFQRRPHSSLNRLIHWLTLHKHQPWDLEPAVEKN